MRVRLNRVADTIVGLCILSDLALRLHELGPFTKRGAARRLARQERDRARIRLMTDEMCKMYGLVLGERGQWVFPGTGEGS